MQRLAQAPNLALATLWADALRAQGIGASVQREFLGAAVGHLPPDQCLPEVWIDDQAQQARALAFLDALRSPPQRLWHCSCGERIEGGFEQCWQCGRLMPGSGSDTPER
ncbi:DUF2007 domain-containing protein [Xenophilus arseniciresistens]|uniref:DUF2007 domain-containing protein n=1 Tax=Xenophilus arseniciresistens TaxID=1283306 RepID=A0AAE3NEY5_9BURK|nr:DUF2007 domain-containing protein [Xenophilus arseniciresistens]MDA7418364.1 DUF2007 domain-containing protein [Xenophilus arseniciresistens]